MPFTIKKTPVSLQTFRVYVNHDDNTKERAILLKPLLVLIENVLKVLFCSACCRGEDDSGLKVRWGRLHLDGNDSCLLG